MDGYDDSRKLRSLAEQLRGRRRCRKVCVRRVFFILPGSHGRARVETTRPPKIQHLSWREVDVHYSHAPAVMGL